MNQFAIFYPFRLSLDFVNLLQGICPQQDSDSFASPKGPLLLPRSSGLHHVLLLTQRCDSWGLLGFAVLLALPFRKMSVCVSVNVTLTVSELGIGNNYLSGVGEYFLLMTVCLSYSQTCFVKKKTVKIF